MLSNQPDPRPGSDSISRSGVRPLSGVQRRLLALAGFGFLLDVSSTWAILAWTLAREANPVMRALIAAFGIPVGVVVSKLLALVILIVALALFPQEWRDRVFTLATGVIAAVGIGFGAWNTYLLLTM